MTVRTTTPTRCSLTPQQTATALLAVLNERVGVRGYTEAYQLLGDLLGIDAEEALLTVDEFELNGICFTKRVRLAMDGKRVGMTRNWGIEERV